MEIDRNARWFRFLVWPEEDVRIPHRISLCALFWKYAVSYSIAKVVIGVLVVATAPIWVPMWAMGKFFGDDFVVERVNAAMDRISSVKSTWAGQLYLTAKGRICPIIQIVDTKQSLAAER